MSIKRSFDNSVDRVAGKIKKQTHKVEARMKEAASLVEEKAAEVRDKL